MAAVALLVVTTSLTSCDPAEPREAAGRPVALPVGSLSRVVEVKPRADHPAAGLDRDAGVSVKLRDGSVVWFFGDTARVRPDWTLEYFVVGTAAWASADEPTRTRDAIVGGQPIAIRPPANDTMPCSPMAPVAGAWPYAAIVVPDGNKDRVLVWVENVCLGQQRNVESRGMAVGEWIYDPSEPHADQPVTLTPLGTLSADRWFGYAATLGPDGWVYAYYCEQFPAANPDGTLAASPECRAARVRPADVAHADRYRVRTRTGWGDDGTPIAMKLPASGSGRDAATVARPPGAFSVAYHEGVRRWVMAYSPWPGQTEELHLRFADHPDGPWTEATPVHLPDCVTRTKRQTFGCYAGSLQPFLDDEHTIGVGWYDRIRATDGVSGNYMVARLGIL